MDITLAMSNPIRQHFIPQSYLKNFSVELESGNSKFGVEAKLKAEDKPKSKLISIKDICVERNIYTIPKVKGEGAYQLERYYATEIDGIYPEVYSMLTDPNVNQITADQKAQIIRTTMSLFFRTPKFLRLNAKRMELILQHALKSADANGNVKFRFRNYALDFNANDLDSARQELLIQNKLQFLEFHLKQWHDFVEFKKDTALTVYRINEPTALITSDNPVVMESVVGNQFSLFDPTNIISVPLDSEHYLTIFPNTEKGHSSIRREERDKWFALTTNVGVERSSLDWILGKPGTVVSHLSDQVKYGEHSEDNLKEFTQFKEKTEDLAELVKTINSSGTIFSIEVAKVLHTIREKGGHNDNDQIQFIISALIAKGLLT